ncbi:MAG: endonuclease I [Myxococcales bacterium]|nr:endonuclease I [Myxococcales bacterium]
MLPELFEAHPRTFYCDCPFEGKEVSLKGCGYKVRKNSKRAKRLEWEHVVPAAAFGRSLKPWAEGHPKCKDSKKRPYKGRRCAEKISKRFRLMEADLYNLRPAIGEVNGDRSDKEVGLVSGEPRVYGACDVEITKDTVEPREAIRGDVARTYLYMNQAYPGTLSLTDEQKAMFEAWSSNDPPDAWERKWADRVEELQGNRNPFIE